MGEWVQFDTGRPTSRSCVVYYVPAGKYIWASAEDYDEVKKEFPGVSHWKIITNAPA
jgi:hypothetical protein